MAAAKVEEKPHHIPQDQLLEVYEYCIDSHPSWLETTFLGFQNYIVMLGSTVMIPSLLVPQMGGSDDDKARVIQSLLFVAGINTYLQTLFGTRLPAIIGGSYAFLIPILTIINSSNLQVNDNQRFISTMKAIQGALIVSSILQIIVGFFGWWGIITRFFSPLGSAPAIALVGLGLYELGFPGVAKCVEVGLLEFLLLVVLSLYLRQKTLKKFRLFERMPILLSVPFIWCFAFILTVGGAYRHVPSKTKVHCRTDQANLITSSPWFRMPYPLQWGAPTFDASHIFGMMAAVFTSSIESTAAFLAISRLASATPPPASVLSRGSGWQGVGTLLSGLFGTSTGSTVLVENAGLLGITGVGSRRVVQISAAFMIFFSLFGKFGALFASIPFPIFAAIYCVLFAIITATGISFLQFVNLNKIRTWFIVGLALFMGISVPRYFSEFMASTGHGPMDTNASWFNDIVNTIFSSAVTVALFVGVLIDNTYEVETSSKDRGMPWWAEFRVFGDDSRSRDFYFLPFNLQKVIDKVFSGK